MILMHKEFFLKGCGGAQCFKEMGCRGGSTGKLRSRELQSVQEPSGGENQLFRRQKFAALYLVSSLQLSSKMLKFSSTSLKGSLLPSCYLSFHRGVELPSKNEAGYKQKQA